LSAQLYPGHPAYPAPLDMLEPIETEQRKQCRARLHVTLREIAADYTKLAEKIEAAYHQAVAAGNDHDHAAATVLCMQINSARAAVGQWQKDMHAADSAGVRGTGQ
jgi:hypothetical protein